MLSTRKRAALPARLAGLAAAGLLAVSLAGTGLAFAADKPATDKVASSADTIAATEVVEKDMAPVEGSALKDGTYDVDVDSSSSMFSVESCKLTVKDGVMSATMTMGGKGYLYVYMGTAEEAAKADEADLVSFEEDADGAHTFTVPVEALDKGIDCAAFSKKKEQWYARTLVFRADSLPADAFADGASVTAASLGLKDGSYTAEVSLEGGSGRASVTSPAKLTVKGGKVTATVEWGSSNYDYMVVDGEKYLPANKGGNSTFQIPVAVFDRKLAVQADTTAMSTPHLIDYTLEFSSSSIKED